LERLPYYTEVDGSGKFNLRASNETEDEAVLLNDYVPFPKIDFLIEAGTRAVIMDKMNQTLIHFSTQLNYFDVLHNEINQLLAYTTTYSEIDAHQLERVTSGVSYLAKAVRRIENPNEISSEMVHPTEMVFDIFLKFKGTQNPPITLLANCLDVCSALVKLFDAEIFNRIISINVLPTLNYNGQDFKALANGRGFESGLVGAYLVNYEKNAGTYEFLMAYLNFLKVYSKVSGYL
jgi:nuclear pore complex protein Nup188